MKTKLTLFVTVLAVALFGMGCSSLDKGLVAYYPFNGNANDESGNGNHGEVQGAKLSEDRNGEQNNAYSFDGEGALIEITSSPSIKAMKAVSISLWLNVDKKQKQGYLGYNTIIQQWAEAKPAVSDQNKASFWIGTHQNKFIVPFANPTSKTNDYVFRASFDSGAWLHVLYTHDSSGAALFFNGEQVGPSKQREIQINEPVTPIYIGSGKGPSAYRQALKGSIDDVRIYNRALSADEVKALYDLEKPKGK